MDLTFLIVLYVISIGLAVVGYRAYLRSECLILKLVNPFISMDELSILNDLDMKMEVLHIVFIGPVIEEFLFRFLPTIAYYAVGSLLPIIMMNIAWIVGHYLTVKSECGLDVLVLPAFAIYAIYAVVFSMICLWLCQYSWALAYAVPTILHMINNGIVVVRDYLARTRLSMAHRVRRNRYWTFRE